MHPTFFELHSGLEREGPGSEASTREALARCGPLPDAPRVVDMGCGPGASAITLARALPDARIVAVDTHGPFLDALTARAAAAGVGDRIETWHGSMLEYRPPEPVDLFWSEGAAYSVGVEAALKAWRGSAAPGARVGLSELVWLSADPPPALRATLQAEYPPMGDRETLRARVAAAGWRPMSDVVLPARDWANYYGPLKARAAAMRSRAVDDPAMAAVLDEADAEAALYAAHGADYGYAFIVAELNGGST